MGINVNRMTAQIRARALARWPNLPSIALPAFILIVVTLVSLIAYSVMNVNLESSRARAMDRRINENQLKVQASMDSYAQLLLGSVGRVNSAELDNASWQRFTAAYDLKTNFSSMEAIGLAYSPGPTQAVVAYVSPETTMTTQAVGFDMVTNEVLASAMNKSARENKITVSDALPGIFSTKADIKTHRPGFLMYAPFYNSQGRDLKTPEERLQAVRGYVSAMFRGDIFFDKVFRDNDWSHTKLSIYLKEESPSHLLYQTGTNTDGKNVRAVSRSVDLYGQKFIFAYSFDTASILVFSQNYLPQFMLFGGLVLAVLFAAIAGFMLRGRYRRLAYEKERDIEFAKDELLSLASHQLRTPATGVKQYLGMVLQGYAGKITEKQREYLERAYAGNDRQLHIINEILHLAKVNAGRIILAKRKFDLAEMIHEIIEDQKPQAEKGQLTLAEKLPAKAIIYGDPHMLRMVVENLVSNAINYTPPGGKVTVRLASRGTWYSINVRDTGVGIAKSDFPKLFQQFSRITNPRSEFVTGTGVGLYLAHHLTVLHEGTISIKSIVGEGSTFTVRLPK